MASPLCKKSPHLIELQEVNSTGVEIGSGAYGRVIEVNVHSTLCAAKEIHSNLVNVSSTEFTATKQKFLDECHISSRIHHPNVVHVLGIYQPTPEAKLPWLVMEMMECSLTGFLEKYKKEKVPVHVKLSMLLDVSQGLEFLHGQDIVHRDLSSNNVLLTKYCVAKIADLGVAKIIKPSEMKLTQAPGTLHFMPPEALSVQPNYNKPVDVFSLGCVACHVMSHQWPVPKDRVIQTTQRVLTEIQRREDYLQSFPQSLLKGSQSSLKGLAELCLQVDPEERPKISTVCSRLKDSKGYFFRDKQIEPLNLTGVGSAGVVIGKGSYGQVIEVSLHGMVCAAREVLANLVEGDTLAETNLAKRFASACLVISRIHHPNVVQMLGIHYPTPEAKLPWLVMEMMEYSLTSFLSKHEKDKLSLSLKLSILVDVSQGLAFLHGQDFVHKNLSSNNVLLTKHYVAKISDVKMADVFDCRELKEQPQRVHFLPPEVLSENPHYDKPVDVFSLACVALHLMSHQWPEPKDYPQDHKNDQNVEVKRREKYLKSCTHPLVQEVVQSCLDDHFDQRPEIPEIHVRLYNIKTAVDKALPLTGANSTELLHASWQKKIHLPEIDTTSTEAVVGTGTFSEVFEVCIHGAQCAAKRIDPKLVESITFTEHEAAKTFFLNECVYASQIHHPNVVQLLGIHYPTSEAKLPWLVMEMMDTGLTGFLEKYKQHKIPHYFKLSILVDVSRGLEFLHSQDIIHGHLSSNEVLLTNHFVAKIADLGVAKFIRKYLGDMQPRFASFFMPPGSVTTPQYDKPVDVFSLGCVACHVMSHQWPEPKDVVSKDMSIIPTEIQKRMEYIQPYADSSLGRLMQSCLVDNPVERSNITVIRVGLEGVKNIYLQDTNQWLAAADRFQLIKVTEEEKARTGNLRANFEAAELKWSNMQKTLDDVNAKIQYIRGIDFFSDQQKNPVENSKHTRKAASEEDVVYYNNDQGITDPASSADLVPSENTTLSSSYEKVMTSSASYQHNRKSTDNSTMEGRQRSATTPSSSSSPSSKKLDQWQCTDCQHLNESNNSNFKGCKMHSELKAFGKATCKSCEFNIFFLSIDSLKNATCTKCHKTVFINTQYFK
ncbi:uncharacterized protein [Dysidea avara]|uniref:uncharacterized protein n=1 Tax=Dysidea avara TaxID=196820 RepID=UPI003323B9B4